MTKVILGLAGGLYAVIFTQLVAAETLHIQVTNVPNSEGQLMLQILAGEAEFKGDSPAVASVMQRAREGEMSFTAGSLPPGEYALRVMHDENNNGKLDTNIVGMPTEPWAFSNNATGNFGPPRWDDVKFTLESETTQTIDLNR